MDAVELLSDWAARSQASFRFRATLLVCFAAVSSILACVGLYAVLSYLVSQNRRNIGIRIALGAGKSQILGEILAQGLSLVVVGIGLGLLVSLATSRLLSSFLFRVDPLDPFTLVLVIFSFLSTAALACLIPAGRATSIDPVIALRED